MKSFFYLIILSLSIYSCGVNRVYTPANYAASKKYVAKPIYIDDNVSANYISLSLSNGEHPYSQEKSDTKLISSLNYHHSKTSKKFNYYFGLGLNYGVYKFKNPLEDVITKNETKDFYVINPKIGFSLKKSYSKVEYHFIGLEMNYNYENGNYQNKLAEINPSSSIRVVNEKSLFSFNLFTEILFKINANKTLGIGLFGGDVLGLDEKKYNINYNDGTGFGGLTFSYRIKKYTFAVVTESGARNIQSINYSFTYQF